MIFKVFAALLLALPALAGELETPVEIPALNLVAPAAETQQAAPVVDGVDPLAAAGGLPAQAADPTVAPPAAAATAQTASAAKLRAAPADGALAQGVLPSAEASPISAEGLSVRESARFDLAKPSFLEGFSPASYQDEGPRSADFVVPNEGHPEDALKILDQNAGDLYVSVGTERGFIGAALAKGITHLLLVDYNPGAIAYNRINAALLQLAKDRGEYRRLRSDSKAEEWRRLAEERGLPVESQKILGDAANWRFWNGMQRFDLLKASEGYFRGSNYLDDDALFGKLKKMADARQIKSMRLDLTDAHALKDAADAIEKSGVKLGVLDISNAWHSKYMDVGQVSDLLHAFKQVTDGQAIFMITHLKPIVSEIPGPIVYNWKYYGFRFEDFFSNALPPDQAVVKALMEVPKYKGNRLNPVDRPPTLLESSLSRLSTSIRAVLLSTGLAFSPAHSWSNVKESVWRRYQAADRPGPFRIYVDGGSFGSGKTTFGFELKRFFEQEFAREGGAKRVYLGDEDENWRVNGRGDMVTFFKVPTAPHDVELYVASGRKTENLPPGPIDARVYVSAGYAARAVNLFKRTALTTGKVLRPFALLGMLLGVPFLSLLVAFDEMRLLRLLIFGYADNGRPDLIVLNSLWRRWFSPQNRSNAYETEVPKAEAELSAAAKKGDPS